MLSKPTEENHNYGEADFRDNRRMALFGGGYVGIVVRVVLGILTVIRGNMKMTKQAYACRWRETLCYVAAETSGKAKAVVNHSLEEYLGEYDQWNKIRCRRAPEYDAWAAGAKGTETMSPAYMPEPARV